LDLLRWLGRAGISVSQPLTARDGRDVHHIGAPEGVRQAVQFTYAPGVVPPFDAETAARLGAGLTGVHLATAGFRSAHARFALDLETLLWRPLKAVDRALAHRPTDTAYLTGLASVLAERLTALAPLLPSGPLHGDVYPGNFHCTPEGALTWFDFDLCGEGWLAYDLAAFQMNLRAGDLPDVWPAFLQSYEAVRALHPAECTALPLLGAVRDIWHLGHYLGGVAAGDESWWLDEAYLDRRMNSLREWVASALGE
jgi:Ser/Thr protein kinase RdoA (MazF antagonist)